MDCYVYILSNKTRTVLYVGMTNDLMRRLREHRNDRIEGFTKRYHVHDLVYYEHLTDINAAIEREKRIKGCSRAKKEERIDTQNPLRRDLAADWFA